MRTITKIAAAVLCLLLAGCNWTDQLDRAAGACLVLPQKDSAATCSVTITPKGPMP